MIFLKLKTKQRLLNSFPYKDLWDIMALTQLFLRGDVANEVPLSFEQKSKCLQFYFNAEGTSRLLAVSNRSGARWIQLAIELALDLQAGGKGEYVFENDHYYPTKGQLFTRLDWRSPSGLWEQQHQRLAGPVIDRKLFLVTHNNYNQLRSRKISQMQTVLVTRSIPAIIASLISKLSSREDQNGTPSEGASTFDWKPFMGKSVDFYNSWGDVMKWHPAIRHYKYENLKADPLGTHMEMLDFWGLPVDEDVMREALFRSSKKEMLKRMPLSQDSPNLRVSMRTQTERRVISGNELRHIVDVLNQELAYDFDYNFDYNTPYDTVYE